MSFVQKTTVAILLALSTAINAQSVIGHKYDAEIIANQYTGKNYVTELDKAGKVAKVIVTGQNGDGSDTTESIKTKTPTFKQTVIAPDGSYSGQKAIDFLGSNIVKVARDLSTDVEMLKSKFLEDPTLYTDEEGHLFYIEPPAPTEFLTDAPTDGSATPTTVKMDAGVDVMKLHSNKNAKVTIYLDMDGETVDGSKWSKTTSLVAMPYATPEQLQNDYFKQNVYSIWSSVAEDYIGMDVDVTTEKPAYDRLFRDTNVVDEHGIILSKDTEYGIHAVITPTPSIRNIVCGQVGGACGGVAFIGSMAYTGNLDGNIVWIFPDALSNNIHNITEATAHEVGHTVGLYHDGVKAIGNNPAQSYYRGHDDWAPIMGVGYDKSITQFSKGEYSNANNPQDDFLVMATYGLTTRKDDVGDTKETATVLHTELNETQVQNIVSNFGVIEDSNDIDLYVFNTKTGPVKFDVNGLGDLFPEVSLLDMDGNVLKVGQGRDAEHWSYGLLQKTIEMDITEGTYYLKIESKGMNKTDYAGVTTNSFTKYGNVGQYSITGNFAQVNYVKPEAVLTSDVTSGIAPLVVRLSAIDSVGNGGITDYSWNDQSYGSSGDNSIITFNKVGTFDIKLTVTNVFGLTDTKTITIKVDAPNTPAIVTHIKSAKMSVVKTGKRVYYKTLITLVNGLNKPVKGATITGKYSGNVDYSYDKRGILMEYGIKTKTKTNAKGQVTIVSPNTPYVHGTTNFEIIDVNVNGFIYNPSANIVGIQSLTRK